MKDILVLADGTEIELESGASLGSMQVVFADKDSMVKAWDAMTDENLKTVQIMDGNGSVIAEYADLVLASVTSTEQEDGTILTTFALREKSEVELLKEQTTAQAEQMATLEEQNAMLSMTVDSILTDVIPSLM